MRGWLLDGHLDRQQCFEVEMLFEHEYLVRAWAEGEVIESRIRVEPGVLAQLGLEGADERRVVKEARCFWQLTSRSWILHS
ncbi:hypothetical protein GCM10009712_24430 [Pseudarthrobacter sulfonivorans]